jgi:glyoxylate reductase
MSKNIFVTRVIPDNGLQMLRDKGYAVDVFQEDRLPTQEEIIGFLQKKPYDAVLTLLTDKIDSKVFDASPSTKIFSNYAMGFDNLDIVEAKKRGIVITNTRGDYGGDVAEHTMAFILNLSTRMVEADHFVRAGKYKGWSPMNFIGSDLKGKVLGLVGVGSIGSRVAEHAFKGFGLKVIYYDVKRNEPIEKECEAEYFENVEDVLKRADFVSLHVPLFDSTHHLINAERLKMMKNTAFLINTARGPVIDELALVEALENGIIKGAGLDVYEFEPKISEGLIKLPNVVLTPHIATARESARNDMSKLAAQNIIDFFETGKATFPVN